MTRLQSIRCALPLMAALSTAFGTPASSAAQITAADSAAVLLDAATNFEARGEFDVAAALYRLVVSRFPGSSSAALAVERLSGASLARSASSGRTELQVWSTLYGLWLGVAVPGFFEANNSEAFGAGLLAGGPAGFLAGRALARSRPLSLGQARAITWGGTWGTLQGLGWAMALDLGANDICAGDVCFATEESDRAIFGSMIAGGAAGLLIGNVLSHRDITDGLATAVNLGSLWGTWFGVAAGVMSDLAEDGVWATALLGGNVGLVATALAGRRWNPTRDRVRLVSIAGVMGGLGGAGLDLLIQPESEKVAIAIPLAASLAGLFIGAANTRDRPDPDGRDSGRPGNRDSVGDDYALPALFNISAGALRIGAPLPGLAQLPATGSRPQGMSFTIPLLSVRF